MERRLLQRDEQLGLPVPGQAGEPDDFTAHCPHCHATDGGGLHLDHRLHAAAFIAVFYASWPRRRRRRHRRDRRLPLPVLRLDDVLAHRSHQSVAVGVLCCRNLHDLPVAHDNQPVGHGKNLAQFVCDQHAGLAGRDEFSDVRQQLRRRLPVERRRRLVQDHQFQRLRAGREGTRHFDQLALADRQLARHVVCTQAVPRKDHVERRHQLRAGARPPRPFGGLRLRDAHVLGQRQVVAQRQLLEHATQAPAPRFAHRPAGADAAAFGLGTGASGNAQLATVRRQGTAQDVDERGLAGPVVTDQPDAFAALQLQRDAAQRPHRAKRLCSAANFDQHLFGFRDEIDDFFLCVFDVDHAADLCALERGI